MNGKLGFAGALALALFMAVAVPGNATTSQISRSELHQKIRMAHTKADHEAIAAFYAARAKDAREGADMHRDMVKDYAAAGKPEDEAQIPLMKSLAKQYDAMAAKYDALAAHHHKMAEAAKQ